MTKKVRRIDALTETGMVKQAVRNGLREEFDKAFFNEEWKRANDNSMLLPIVESYDGTPVYIRVQVSVTTKDEFATGKAKPKKDDKLDLSNLF